MNPSVHLHISESPALVQVPPLRQGLLAHAFTWTFGETKNIKEPEVTSKRLHIFTMMPLTLLKKCLVNFRKTSDNRQECSVIPWNMSYSGDRRKAVLD